MKNHYIIAALSLAAVVQTASAQTTLFSDNFTAPDGFNGNQDLNIDLNTTRLGGTLAPGLIISGTVWNGTGGQHQLGNPDTDVGQPGGASNSGYTLLGGGDGTMQSAFDVAALATGPITISFDMYNLHTSGEWTTFTLAGANFLSDKNPVVGANQFGMLVRPGGGVQVFQNGGNVAGSGGWDNAGFALDPLWSFTFSDTLGTGSAFNGNGSQVTIVNGATTLGTLTLSQQLNNSGLYIGFRANDLNAGIDNVLMITPVPEPSTFVLATAGIGCLALVRRYRRA